MGCVCVRYDACVDMLHSSTMMHHAAYSMYNVHERIQIHHRCAGMIGTESRRER